MGIFDIFKKKKQEQVNIEIIQKKTYVGNVFLDKYPYGNEPIEETISIFNKDFKIEKFVLPKGFREFIATKKRYGFPLDEVPEFETIPYEEILDVAYNLIMGSDIFSLPPLCIPFGSGESGHEVYSLDYSQCGINGEPQVILTDDEEIDYEDNEDVSTYNFNKVYASKDFEQFLKIVREK
ncbi:MAG: hypothetical protein FWE22_06775 [Firmicutes bacterium]|nr:hypothetical protein [Bacillota bacterium]